MRWPSEGAHKSADVAAIDTAIAELNAAWQAASQDIYAQQQAQGAHPGDAGQSQSQVMPAARQMAATALSLRTSSSRR
ncbi:MAG: hypothetical protein ACLR93_09410 [Alistipes onderdonkii]